MYLYLSTLYLQSIHLFIIFFYLSIHLSLHHFLFYLSIYISIHLSILLFLFTGWSKKSLWSDLEEKCLGNSCFLMYSHLLKKLELSILSYVEKKLWGSKNPKNGLFQKSYPIKKETYLFVLFLILLQDNSYSCSVFKFKVSKLKIAIEVMKLSIYPQKCLFLKRKVKANKKTLIFVYD